MKEARGLRPSLHPKESQSRKAIGLFDSGLGGLTVCREVQQVLPEETILYFGDLARLPYGTKSQKQILEFSLENTEFLLEQDVKALVIACNSSASASLDELRRRYTLPIIDVIRPATEVACKKTKTRRIGVIGTQATVESRTYEREIRLIDPRIRVFMQACNLFVPLVEEGWMTGDIPLEIIRRYLTPLLREKIDTLILGCTHYPLLRKSIEQVIGEGIELVDSAVPTVHYLKWILEAEGILRARSDPRPDLKPERGELEIFVSDTPRNFLRIGERFLGRRLNRVSIVSLENGKWKIQEKSDLALIRRS